VRKRDCPRNVAAWRRRGEERRAPAVLARHEHAFGDGFGRPRGSPRRPIQLNRTARDRRESEQGAKQAAFTRAERADHRNDFARVNIKVEGRRGRAQADASEVENDAGCLLGGGLPSDVGESATDHRPHCGGEIEWLRLVSDAAPIAQYHYPVGDAPDVAKPMRNIEHADAALSESINHREQTLGLQGRQTGRWFIEDQDRRVCGDRPSDGDKLTMSGTEAAEVQIDRHFKSDAIRDLSRLGEQAPPRHKRA
jgi:hypothetical protein